MGTGFAASLVASHASSSASYPEWISHGHGVAALALGGQPVVGLIRHELQP